MSSRRAFGQIMRISTIKPSKTDLASPLPRDPVKKYLESDSEKSGDKTSTNQVCDYEKSKKLMTTDEYETMCAYAHANNMTLTEYIAFDTWACPHATTPISYISTRLVFLHSRVHA